MNKEKINNNFLARWISGELSSKELEEFKKTEDYLVYKKINDASERLSISEYDVENEFKKVQKKINSKKQTKIVKLIPTIFYKVAASAIILLGILYFFNKPTTYATSYGEKINITLPDNSIVHLNSNSEVTFDDKSWNKNRIIKLMGEGFFEVEKGSNFIVETSTGTVEVLGTKFTVLSQEDYLEVQCYEGKVRVNSDDKQTILNPTNAYRNVNSNSELWNFTNPNPTWLFGETTFTNTPIKQVIKALEDEFEIKFSNQNIDMTKRFTGSFAHSDINIALKTVFVPMDISFTFKGENSVVLVNSK